MFKTIRARLLASFLVILLFMGGLGGTAYYMSTANGKLVKETIERDFNGSVLIAKLAVEAQKIRRFEKEYIIYVSNAEKAQKYQNEWRATYDTIKHQLNAMLMDRRGMWSEAEYADFTQWKAGLLAYEEGFEKLVNAVQSGAIKDAFAANAAIGEAKDKFRVLLDGTSKVGETKLHSARAAETKIAASTRILVLVLAGAVGGTLVLCLLLVIVVPVSITRPITMLSQAATAMSHGDLEQAIPSNVGIRDFVGLAETLERMRISLKIMMERFVEAEPGQGATPSRPSHRVQMQGMRAQ